MKLFVISGVLHKTNTSKTISEELKDLVSKPGLKMLSPSDSTLSNRVKQEKPAVAIFHKIPEGKAEALKKIIDKMSPETKILKVDDDWSVTKALLTRLKSAA